MTSTNILSAINDILVKIDLKRNLINDDIKSRKGVISRQSINTYLDEIINVVIEEKTKIEISNGLTPTSTTDISDKTTYDSQIIENLVKSSDTIDYQQDFSKLSIDEKMDKMMTEVLSLKTKVEDNTKKLQNTSHNDTPRHHYHSNQRSFQYRSDQKFNKRPHYFHPKQKDWSRQSYQNPHRRYDRRYPFNDRDQDSDRNNYNDRSFYRQNDYNYRNSGHNLHFNVPQPQLVSQHVPQYERRQWNQPIPEATPHTSNYMNTIGTLQPVSQLSQIPKQYTVPQQFTNANYFLDQTNPRN